MVKTEHQKDIERRHKRIIERFKKLQEENPDIAPSRLAALVTDYERNRADGIRTVVGVTRILKRYGLWQGKGNY